MTTNQHWTLSRPVIRGLYSAYRLYAATFRLALVNDAPWRRYVDQGGRVLLCTWHQQFFTSLAWFARYRNYRPAIIISRSRDGERIARVAAHAGWSAVRGSTSEGGSTALKQMIRHMRASRLCGHILDGPRGPAGTVKPGVIHLARAAGAVIVPVYVSADPAWHFNSWDYFMLPRPFARVTLHFLDMLPVSAQKDKVSTERQRQHLENLLRPGLVLP